MSDRVVNRPEWYFRRVLVTWRLWAVGFYDTRRFNWQARNFALGPFRFQFVKLNSRQEREAYRRTQGETQ